MLAKSRNFLRQPHCFGEPSFFGNDVPVGVLAVFSVRELGGRCSVSPAMQRDEENSERSNSCGHTGCPGDGYSPAKYTFDVHL
jgi:hypothetical protein